MFDERQFIYEQMRLIIDERRELTKIYYELKERLQHLGQKDSNPTKEATFTNKQKLAIDIENQQYFLNKKNQVNQNIYQRIVSISKESHVPMTNRELFEQLTEKYHLSVSYNNLTNNILSRMNQDSSCKVERAYRDYWQYRMK
ncbi:hypothetical protein [Enterococcus caccae]|uniref:Uncharacterized protein n=1 Tax=Enterococcus caccae ATCC BAA-1240 TaxID=1158612 RepID=R3W817_9ENTE|nr:hypothetical protein [Enterococcus caccae]EOL43647.1 hypothetical protein UC7_02977 [Enterococcus caccae ATCC BAA-1240]EOT67953.1 hypothetical protein I580_00335 [Enterococcus caccae ATCC BAA-1240]OJG28557.1 hypothetical protein RU98_GL000150 [Enterococcus caccae]